MSGLASREAEPFGFPAERFRDFLLDEVLIYTAENAACVVELGSRKTRVPGIAAGLSLGEISAA